MQTKNVYAEKILKVFFAISANPTILKKPLTNKQAVKTIKEFLKYFNLACETNTTFIPLPLAQYFSGSFGQNFAWIVKESKLKY